MALYGGNVKMRTYEYLLGLNGVTYSASELSTNAGSYLYWFSVNLANASSDGHNVSITNNSLWQLTFNIDGTFTGVYAGEIVPSDFGGPP
jgi:hypothetical protein